MITLIHATLTRNLPSIRKRGLLASKATRKRKAVWLASETDEQWAVKHVLHNRNARMDEVVLLTVQVPESWVKGFRHGLWYCTQDIPPSCLRRVKRFQAVEEVIS